MHWHCSRVGLININHDNDNICWDQVSKQNILNNQTFDWNVLENSFINRLSVLQSNNRIVIARRYLWNNTAKRMIQMPKVITKCIVKVVIILRTSLSRWPRFPSLLYLVLLVYHYNKFVMKSVVTLEILYHTTFSCCLIS